MKLIFHHYIIGQVDQIRIRNCSIGINRIEVWKFELFVHFTLFACFSCFKIRKTKKIFRWNMENSGKLTRLVGIPYSIVAHHYFCLCCNWNAFVRWILSRKRMREYSMELRNTKMAFHRLFSQVRFYMFSIFFPVIMLLIHFDTVYYQVLKNS